MKKDKKENTFTKIHHILREIPFFEDFSSDELDFFSKKVSLRYFPKKTSLFKEGDIGDYLYIITDGKVEVVKKDGGKVAELGKGEFFGEIALLNQRTRTATIKCLEPTDVLALRKSDFGVLIANFRDLRETFEKAKDERTS